ncbi:unnamed protein product [Parnassius mnemosyne]|uniref:Uncharacterized protein n=1 Tax=Parnassius mnemosyne TaxID=213953 RepID=A0AAV1LGI9_9NEOP
MVGSLMLWKLVHCKRLKKRKSCDAKKDISENTHITAETTIKKTFNDADVKQTCRVCLKEGDIPIYDDSRLEDISEALHNFGGIDVRPGDIYPKYLCQPCYALLQGAILFRKTAQESDQLLRFPPQEAVSDNENSLCGEIKSSLDFIKKEDNLNKTTFTEFIGEDKPKKYLCKKCNADFDTFIEYSEHRLSQEHENVRQKCPICNNTYSSLYFKKHMALHTLESSYMCDVCGKKFVVQGQFTRHRATHFNNLPFKCSLCPYKGRFKEALKMHMRSHTGEKPYQCGHCPSKFVNKSNLNKHMLTHKSGFDFKCETCGRGFYTNRALDLHFKVDHAGIKDHICNICGKAFGYRKQMMKHQLKVHKREKQKCGRMPLYLQVESKKQQI